MKQSGITWNDNSLDRFLAAPMKAVPGTTMTYDGVLDRQARAMGRDVDLRISPEAGHFVISGQILGPDELGEFRIHGVRAGTICGDQGLGDGCFVARMSGQFDLAAFANSIAIGRAPMSSPHSRFPLCVRHYRKCPVTTPARLDAYLLRC